VATFLDWDEANREWYEPLALASRGEVTE